MKNIAWKLSAAAILAAACIFITGCGRSAPNKPGDGEQGTKLEGRIRVSGAFALYPMMQVWADEFMKLHPGVRIEVSGGGAGKGMTDALGGLVEIGMVSRAISPSEVEKGAFYVPCVTDAVFPTISTSNPMLKELLERGVRKQALADLWINGKSTTWGEIAGTDNAEAVHVYTRSDACGAADVWALYLASKKQDDLKGTAVPDDPGVASAVKNDRLGIGYNNLNFAFNATTGQLVEGIAVLPIDLNENGKIDDEERLATMEQAITAIRNKVYPSPPARVLNLVTKTKFEGPTAEFVRWILGDGQKLALPSGYLPLFPDQLESALKTMSAN